jgi:hypothetical protein
VIAMGNPHRETLPQFHERAEQAVPAARSGEAAHTPGPWMLERRVDGGGNILGADGSWVGSYQSVQNAAYIVHIENCHAEMLAALKIAQQWMPTPSQAYEPKARQEAEIVAAAIAKATGAAS